MQAQNQFIEIAREAIAQLRRLSNEFPQLSSRQVQVALETWNEEMFQKGEIIWLEKERKRLERSAMESRAKELLEAHLVDDALEMLNDEFSREMDYRALLDLGGRDHYIDALRREAMELKVNAISPEQTADLWNGAGKPAVGDERWNASAVSVLMG